MAGGPVGLVRRVRASWRRWVAVVLAFNIALGMGFSVVSLRHQADARAHANVLFADWHAEQVESSALPEGFDINDSDLRSADVLASKNKKYPLWRLDQR